VTESDPRSQARNSVIAALFAFSAAQNELARLFARSRGMHTTDATAIVQIIEAEDLGQPLTPARLAERIALTSGATSILLNRLEEAGHIRRTRENTDRRVVTLHSTPEIQRSADEFYEPLARRLGAALASQSRIDLEVVERVVGQLNSTMDDYLGSVGPVGE
jgi:DNA-binding MarR family transcriptional regulator